MTIPTTHLERRDHKKVIQNRFGWTERFDRIILSKGVKEYNIYHSMILDISQSSREQKLKQQGEKLI